jgi:hypothetical protein
MDPGKALILLLLLCIAIAVRQFADERPGEANPQAAAQWTDGQVKADRLASQASCLSRHPHENFTIAFPSLPTEDSVPGIGLKPSVDKVWRLRWHYDTDFEVRYRRLSDSSDRTDPDLQRDRSCIIHEMKQLVNSQAGRFEEWAVHTQREFLFDGQSPAVEFAYTSKKGPQQVDYSGRCWIIKFPQAIYVLSIDGDPETVASPLADSFFRSFRYSAPAGQPEAGQLK